MVAREAKTDRPGETEVTDGPGFPAGPTGRPSPAELAAVLERLHTEMRQRFDASADVFSRVHPRHRRSAANLMDYLTLRQYDLRALQDALAELGLSSLGRSEEHVITTLERVLDTLHLLAGSGRPRHTEAAVDYAGGREILEANARILLGPTRPDRPARILVTMPSEAADDPQLLVDLVERGMDLARINGAHDGPQEWARMVEHVRAAGASVGRPCPILMDLPGPKLRTGPIEAGPRVVRLRPRRDASGRLVRTATARLVPGDGGTPRGGTKGRIPVEPSWLSGLAAGDRIELEDARGEPRTLVVTNVDERGAEVEAAATTYLATGTRLHAPGGVESPVGLLEARPQALRLRMGDLLTLTTDLTPVPVPDETAGRARIGCTLPDAVDLLRVGHRVIFDDGKITGVVEATRPGEADVRITIAAPSGSKLRAEKGINVPDSDLRVAGFTPDDERVLAFAAEHADIAALSFAQDPADVALLQQRLAELDRADLGIVLKIETVRGFAELPDMLLTAMASERIGVMVARGDLAVECGYERLAEVQEEMLWLCEAAHVPVIWATQVLDQQARTGRPSRAEISDAALAGRAECVMLNKGPYIREAVSTLDDILHRMGSHQRKKASLLRQLHAWSSAPA